MWRGKDWSIGMRAHAPLENAMLPKGGARWRSFSAGAVVQVLMLVILLIMPLLFPDRIVQFRRYLSTEIAPSSPVVDASRPWKPKRHKSVPLVKTTTPELPVPHVDIPTPAIPRPIVRPTSIDKASDAPTVAAQTPVALSETTAPNLVKPREPVRVGGFGDPSGVPGPKTALKSNVAQVGEFNLSSGPAGGGPRGGGAVREGLFANEQSSATNQSVAKTVQVSSRSKPVEVLYKPTPTYTEVARSKKIQGEVLLRVLFSASGQVKVLSLVRGLGYGLDEAAEEAAHQIKFKPAEDQDGNAIDSTAVVHIVFELAY